LTFERSVTLIEGKNGAGKTSLLNAIVWCLTGHVYRAQRPPEAADGAVPIRAVEADDSGDADLYHDICSITPLPPAEVLHALGAENVPLDTAVELSFVDESGSQVGSIVRVAKRTSRGKPEVTEPDFSVLGLDPMAREVGTKLPGLIPYIRPGAVSDLGKAVSALTGIKPLEDLVAHAGKSKSKLEGELARERQAEIAELDHQFTSKRNELEELVREHREIDPQIPLPLPGADRSIEGTLEQLADRFEALQAKTLQEAQSILGNAFDARDRDSRQDLVQYVGPAIGLLDATSLARLSSAARLRRLGALEDEQLANAEALIQALVCQASELAAIWRRPDLASRLRLYTRVASWLRDVGAPSSGVKECPVCLSGLKGKVDPVSRKPVAEHIEECLTANKEYLEKSLSAWEQSAVQLLYSELPQTLQAELAQDLPDSPADLMSHALAEELFQPTVFRGALAPLKEATRSRCSATRGCLRQFAEPPIPDLPEQLPDGVGSLRSTMVRACRAIAFARWRKGAGASCKEFYDRVIGEREREAAPTDVPPGDWPLLARLSALDRMVKTATPLTEASAKIKAMGENLVHRRKQEDRTALYARAAEAIRPLLALSDLVEQQVAFLMSRLSKSTKKWRDGLYVPAFHDAPKVTKTDVGTDGGLAFEAEAGGTIAPADHVSNASDLRATLLSFLLAFWEHLLTERGGLSLLLLDDLQELFDPHNRQRVANSIPAIAQLGGHVVITTNDHEFGRRIEAACNRELGQDSVDRRRIHPLNASRGHLELGCFQEKVNRRRDAFLEPANENQDEPAQDYIKDLRIYLEQRLLDLFDVPEAILRPKPTLGDLLSAVRARVNAGHDAFTSKPFRDFVTDAAFAAGSEFLELMNKSHHGREHEIVFNEVLRVKDECARAQTHVEAVHEEYERYMRRDPREPIIASPEQPPSLRLPRLDVPVVDNLAAFTSSSGPTEAALSEERLPDDLLAEKAIYVINTHNLGFSAQVNCRVIVRLSDARVPDNSLVVALHKDKVYARRLLQSTSSPGMIALGSDARNPRKRPPSLFLPAGEVRLLMVIGVLFDDRPQFPRSSDEAVLVDRCDLLERVEIAFRVRGDSALPLALPDQIILGGSSLLPSQLGGMEGCPVAIATTEGAAFKRIGQVRLRRPPVRQFESVGGLGESMLVRTEEVDGALPDVPLLVSIRHVLGVLYEVW